MILFICFPWTDWLHLSSWAQFHFYLTLRKIFLFFMWRNQLSLFYSCIIELAAQHISNLLCWNSQPCHLDSAFSVDASAMSLFMILGWFYFIYFLWDEVITHYLYVELVIHFLCHAVTELDKGCLAIDSKRSSIISTVSFSTSHLILFSASIDHLISMLVEN